MAKFYSRSGFNKISVDSVPKTLKDEYLLVKSKLKQSKGKIVAMVIC